MPRLDVMHDPQAAIRRVYAYVAYRVGEGADAEDITSATIERALRYRETFDARRGEPNAWLIGIARRCIAEHVENRPLVTDHVPDAAAQGELASESASRLDLRRAVASLGDRERELVALRYGADLTARQIGELLEMKTNAVEVALHRALQALRGALEGVERRQTAGEGERSLRTVEE